VERANRTLQDRLVKELRVDGISDMDAGNRFLPGFVQRFNERFALRTAKPEDLHRQVKIAPSRLSDILCHREQRYVGAQLRVHYDRKQIILERSDISENLGGQYVELYDFVDRPLEVRCKGCYFPIGSSAKTSVSITPPSLRTNASATPLRQSRRSRT
jgi:hypothetical protein